MSRVFSELDYALNCAHVEIDTTNARAEFSALRAAVAQARDILSSTEFCTSKECKSCNRVRAWLAAHPATAPQPQEEQVK